MQTSGGDQIMRKEIAKMLLLSLAVCFVGQAACQDAQAKTYTYKYSETIKSSFPNEAVISSPVVVERPVLSTRVIHRPIAMERTSSTPIIVEQPVVVHRRPAARRHLRHIAARPIVVNRVVEHRVVVDRPVYRAAAYPVVVEHPVYVEHRHKGLIPKLYSLIF
jgi:hypothetical protein